MRTILYISLLASIITMKSFKTFLLQEENKSKPDHIRSLYRALISAEHRGVVKDPTKFDPKLHIRTKYKPENDISTAYGPAQITLQTASDALERHKEYFSPEDLDYTTKFIEQGKKMKSADPKDPTYGYGCKGDLCDPKYHEGYERMGVAILKGKLKDAGLNPEEPLDSEKLTTAIQRWRGAPEQTRSFTDKKGKTKTQKGDPDYYKIVRQKYTEFTTPAQTTPQPTTEEKPKNENVPPPNPMTATSTDEDYYTVKGGDSIWKIGGSTPQGVKKITELNPSIDPNKIKPGQKIRTR